MVRLQRAEAAASVAHGVSVSRLVVSEFRSFASLRLITDSRPVVLTGPNGAGKTNLLEALSFLSPGRGLRNAQLRDVDREGARGPGRWAVAASLDTPLGPVEVGTGPSAEDGRERRVVKLDGRVVRGQAALAEVVSVTWLTPVMDRLFVEGAAGRRRFVDRLVFGFDPGHAKRLAAYERALRERARLLHGAAGEPAWLRALEGTMAESGVAIAAARREALARLEHALKDGVGPFPGARLAMAGSVDAWLGEMPAVEAERRLMETLEASRAEDAEGGGAGQGPHKSDLLVRHAATGRPAEQCSTGEQKALLLVILLANARLQTVRRRSPPLLLLDEVAAHLDRAHRDALFEEISALGAQAWLTGTDRFLFAGFEGGAQFFTMEEGRVMGEVA
ncbi:MAG: DNA replication/repair protein RecF [Alphaproteobacteria bacterium]